MEAPYVRLPAGAPRKARERSDSRPHASGCYPPKKNNMIFTLSQYDILGQLAADRSSWITGDDYPSTVICRRIISLADWAAENPERWRVSRLSFECPELSNSELAAALELPELQINRFLAPADLIHPADRSALACPLYDDIPEHIQPECCMRQRAVPLQSVSYCNGVWLAAYAASRPHHWQAWRMRWQGLLQSDIAKRLGITQPAVCKLLFEPIVFTQKTKGE